MCNVKVPVLILDLPSTNASCSKSNASLAITSDEKSFLSFRKIYVSSIEKLKILVSFKIPRAEPARLHPVVLNKSLQLI